MSDIKDLLKPRYKVIADYPGNIHPLGKIHGHNINGTINKMPIDEWIEWHEKYPANFKKLEWWEDRELPQMPEYMKIDGRVVKVKEWSWDYFDKDTFPETRLMCLQVQGDDHDYFEFKEYLPATKEEYENQNK